MEIKDFFAKMPMYNNKELKNTKKEMIDSYVIRFDNYQIGNVTYKFIKDDKYYTYIYVCDKDNSRSNLLSKEFADIDECKKYANYLKKLCDKGNLQEIYDLVK